MKKYISIFNILLMSIVLGLSACSDSDENNGQVNTEPGEDDKIVLNNQFVCKDEIKDIQSVLRFDQGYNAVFYLSPTANIQDLKSMQDANDYLKISMPTGRLGLNTDFSQTGMKVEYNDVKLKSGRGAKGPMKIEINGENLKLEVVAEAEEVIECKYEGKFTYQISENQSTITPMGGEATSAKLVSAFRTQAKGEKRTVTFALGHTETDTPNGLSASKYTILFMAPMKHFDGQYHTFKKADGYELYLIDNENKSYANEVTEGRMRITGKTTDEKMHLLFEATLSDGSKVVGDYYGTIQDVADMDILPASNTYTSEGGYEQPGTQKIIEVLYQYNAGKKEHKFGFKYNEYQEFGGYPSLLEVTINDNTLGVVNGDLPTTPGWKIRYGYFQIEYITENDPNAQYKSESKGSITAIKLGENYRFNISAESIPLNSWEKPANIKLSYEGPVTVVE